VGKHLDKLGKFESYKAPWESETGSDEEIDAEKFKKFLFNLLSDKAKAEDAAEEAVTKAAEQVTSIQAELDAAKADVAKGDSTGKIAELETKLAEAESAKAGAETALVRLEVATEKGLTPKQAKRLQGKNREEFEADADELLEDLGVQPGKTEENDDDEGEGRTAPRRLNLVNAGDSGSGGAELDYDKLAGEIVGGGNF